MHRHSRVSTVCVLFSLRRQRVPRAGWTLDSGRRMRVPDRITVGVQQAACPSGSATDESCFASWIVPGVHNMCPASSFQSVEFEPPETGDVVASLDLD